MCIRDSNHLEHADIVHGATLPQIADADEDDEPSSQPQGGRYSASGGDRDA